MSRYRITITNTEAPSHEYVHDSLVINYREFGIDVSSTTDGGAKAKALAIYFKHFGSDLRVRGTPTSLKARYLSAEYDSVFQVIIYEYI